MWDDGVLWEGAKRGELLLRACAQCEAICHPPLPMCPVCQSTASTTRRACGRGRVTDWIVSTHPARPLEPARIVAVVRLEEGVSFVANIVDANLGGIAEGLPVEVCFQEVDGVVIPQFRLAAQAGAAQ